MIKKMDTKLGYAPEWKDEHTKRVEQSLKSKTIPLTILQGIMKI